MPRTARTDVAGLCYHVCSRGNARPTVFHGTDDYRRFLAILRNAAARTPIDLLAYCLMPNHIHLVVRTGQNGDLGRFMHRLLTAHVRNHAIRHATVGRIWQGRFKAFPIQADSHLLTVMRYVERNAVAAGLVGSAGAWPWSSIQARLTEGETGTVDAPLVKSPIDLPQPWLAFVDTALTTRERERLRECGVRGRPFGSPAWTQGAAERLGLTESLAAKSPRPRRLSARWADR
jgi:putative transposase